MSLVSFACAPVYHQQYGSVFYDIRMQYYIPNEVCDSTHLRQRSSGRFNGNFAVVGDRSGDLNGLAWHIGTLVQTHLTLDQTGSQAHGL